MTNASKRPPRPNQPAAHLPWFAIGVTIFAACAAPTANAVFPEKPTTTSATAAPASAAPTASTAPLAPPRPLSATETRITSYIDEHRDEALALLERVVNINSGTMNFEGVKQVGAIFDAEFKALGFTTRWIPMDAAHRAGHLFAERTGTKGKRLLLIGHLDTVFEKDNPFQRYELLSPTKARGPGVVDMKGGDIAILYALKALGAAGQLEDTQIVVAFTGDEESAGDPVETARKDLIEVAKRSDAAFEFEQGIGGPNSATVARRGAASWTLRVRGKPGHSSGIFSADAGSGAIYEVSRILHTFYQELRGEPNLTFNAGLIVGGNIVEDKRGQGTATGKNNIIPQTATVTGDIRTLTFDQLTRTKERMRAIVQKNLPQTSAEIVFDDGYPPMAPTEGNWALLRELQGAVRDLGLGPIDVIDPGKRGAADVSFVAPFVASLAGMGPSGDGAHAPGETMDLPSLPIVTKRAALLFYRLTR
ncbi:MAG TPA: M20/M25/M40 family metallo-hydrolase [Polyangium sp.]|nr:M20/M25/M40 family metallo-hydrolase [Polyangium sp.]